MQKLKALPSHTSLHSPHTTVSASAVHISDYSSFVIDWIVHILNPRWCRPPHTLIG